MPADQTLKIESERRWAMTAGILAVLGVTLIAGSYIYNGSVIPAGDGGSADYLVGIEAHRTVQLVSSLFQALGYMFLVAPLVFLFKAAAARSPRVRNGLIGVVIAAPLFMGIAAITNSASNLDAASEYRTNGPALVQTCVREKSADAGNDQSADADSPEQVKADCEDEVADDLRGGTSTSGLTAGFGLAGVLGFTIGVVYISLWLMRTGLLTRFWGSLGMALGAVSILFPLFVLLWFIYVGLLIAGWVPGGRPPAWAAGEAIPWPDPRKDAGGDSDDTGDGGDVIEGSAEPLEETEFPPDPEFPPDDSGPQIERRKRKRRNG